MPSEEEEQPRSSAKGKAKAKGKASPKSTPKSKAKAKAKAVEKASPKAKTMSRTVDRVITKAKAKSKSMAKAKPKPKPQTKAKAKATPKVKVQVKTKIETIDLTPRRAGHGAVESLDDEPEEPKPKAKPRPKTNLRQKLLSELGERPIDELLADVRLRIEALRKLAEEAQFAEDQIAKEADHARKLVEDASAQVDEATQRETDAIENLRITREAQLEASKSKLRAQSEKSEAERCLDILELEAASRAKVKQLEDARQQAVEASEAAKQAVQDAKAREKEMIEQMKATMVEQKEKEVRLMEQMRSDAAAEKDKAKEARLHNADVGGHAPLSEARALEKELSEVEKMRVLREKGRQARKAEVLGKGAKRKLDTAISISDSAGDVDGCVAQE